MKVNAADQIRQLLTKSAESTGYSMSLLLLKIHSMVVQNNSLVVDIDGNFGVD